MLRNSDLDTISNTDICTSSGRIRAYVISRCDMIDWDMGKVQTAGDKVKCLHLLTTRKGKLMMASDSILFVTQGRMV